MNFLKLIQLRSDSSTCKFDSFKYNDSDTYCINPLTTDTSPYMNTTFYQDALFSDRLIQGLYKNYDYSGYNISLEISDNSYIQTISNLKNVINQI